MSPAAPSVPRAAVSARFAKPGCQNGLFCVSSRDEPEPVIAETQRFAFPLKKNF